MTNSANKQARSVVIGDHVEVAQGWQPIIGHEHVYSYNNPSRRKTVATVTLELANGDKISLSGNSRIHIKW